MPLLLGAETYGLPDFTAGDKTAALFADGIVGAGIGNTIIDLTGPLQTQFPDPATIKTTRYNVIRIQGTAKKKLAGTVLKGFTLRVSAKTNAAQLFNGLLVAYAEGLLAEDVEIQGVPGSRNGPPGETFGLDLSHVKDFKLRGVIVDGQQVSAAGIGTNNCSDGLLDSCQSTNSLASHNFTHWTSQRLTHVSCVAANAGTGTGSQAGACFSHEECTAMVHVGSQATGGSLASFRYRGTAASTQGHYLIRSNGDGALRLEKKQRASDIEDSTSIIMGGLVQA